MRIRDLFADAVTPELWPLVALSGQLTSDGSEHLRRLFRKEPTRESELRALFHRHRGDLGLNAFGGEALTEDDFVALYPVLPSQVALLTQIAAHLGPRSARARGDDPAAQGLLQLLGPLFREPGLGERAVGDLVTLDAVYDAHDAHDARDADVQAVLARLVNHPDLRDSALALRAAKAVALLGLIPGYTPTTPELVARSLYARVGDANEIAAVTAALERLRSAGLLSYSEPEGYTLQRSAGQEWQRERDDLVVTQEQISELVREKLKELVSTPERGLFKGRLFPWSAWYSDEKQANDVRIQDPRDEASVTIDFRFLLAKEERTLTDWIRRSEQEVRRDRIVWVVGEPARILPLARDLARSRHMVSRNEPGKAPLTPEKQRLVSEELGRVEALDGRLRDCVAEAFLEGDAFFRGRALRPQEFAGAFATALTAIATRVLPDLYPQFTEVAVTEAELQPLLDPALEIPSAKFLEGGLGIFSVDADRVVPTCEGAEPARILQFVTEAGGASGATVISRFGRPPYGYSVDVVKACVVGLLRAGRIQIGTEAGPEVVSIEDPGAGELFRRDRDLRRATLVPVKDQAITARDRVAICGFFKKRFGLDLERQNEAIADAVFQCFPKQRDALREVEAALGRLSGRSELPEALQALGKALDECCRSRQGEAIVIAVKRHLDVLTSGMEQLGEALARSGPAGSSSAGLAVEVEARVLGREIATKEQLEALLAELRERVEAKLGGGARVRLV